MFRQWMENQAYSSPDDFYKTLDTKEFTKETALAFIRYQMQNGHNVGYDLSDLGHDGSNFVDHPEITAYVLKNKIAMPLASYLYHGSETGSLSGVMANGLDNSLGSTVNRGMMAYNLGSSLTTATGDLNNAKFYAGASARKKGTKPVIYRFKPNTSEPATLSYIGVHSAVPPQELEYSLDGMTWQKHA